MEVRAALLDDCRSGSHATRTQDGVSVIEFADLFPSVTIEQARSVLEHVAKSSLATT